MSEYLMLINPRPGAAMSRRRKRKGRMPAALRRYWASHRRKARRPRRASARRRRRSRAVVAFTPRRRHHRRHHYGIRRRRARNPRFLGGGMMGQVKGTLVPAAFGAGGAIALDVLYGFISPKLPTTFQTGPMTLLVKLAGAIGIGYAASKVLGQGKGRTAALGAATVVSYSFLKSYVAQALPSLNLSGYSDFVDYSVARTPPGVGAYLPNRPGMNGLGFISPAAVIGDGTSSNMGAYMGRPGMNGLGDIGAYDWRNDGM